MIPNELIRDALEAALVVAIKDPAGSPKSLQPFLKFQKMPARAMPAVRKVLDTDDAFRERVASVVALGVLDQAGVLFLTRPEGWEAELERLASEGAQAEADAEAEKAEKSAQRKLKAAEAARTKAEERVNDLTGELERTRAVLEQERVAKRQAETTAHNVTWDVDNLRKRVRELESAADAWAQERDELKRQVATAAPSATPVPSPAPVEALDLSGVTDALREARLRRWQRRPARSTTRCGRCPKRSPRPPSTPRRRRIGASVRRSTRGGLRRCRAVCATTQSRPLATCSACAMSS